jgi:hypothetical protein
VLVSVASVCAMGVSLAPAAAEPTPVKPSVSGTAALDAFRVLPYLLKPAHDQMTINWITETPYPWP